MNKISMTLLFSVYIALITGCSQDEGVRYSNENEGYTTYSGEAVSNSSLTNERSVKTSGVSNDQVELHKPYSSQANASAVILQYHHVGVDTPPSTSVTPEQFEQHLNWIESNGFEVLPLPRIVETLTGEKKFRSDKVVAITFDDANISVCNVAWPILKKHRLPFTLFITTEAVENEFATQCSWDMLKDMVKSGLMTPANHSHRHLNMISRNSLTEGVEWKSTMISEVSLAQELIQSKLGTASKLFAYPYGEYNSALSSLITELGFVGFGQYSGAVGYHSDFSALPRFPVSAQYANMDTLKVKLLSLPFPASISTEVENPIELSGPNNPPQLILHPHDPSILSTTACFDSQGEQLPSSVIDGKIVIQPSAKLSAGRHRYTFTSESDFPNRFYWGSHQWLVE